MNHYAHAKALVDTQWVKDHLGRRAIKIIEIDLDTRAHEAGHIPGAMPFNWQTDLQDQTRRDILSRVDFEELAGGAGITPSDTVVFYGDQYNWMAAWGFWLFKYYGHKDVRLMNGGRKKWLNEEDRPIAVQETAKQPVAYQTSELEASIRVGVAGVLAATDKRTHNLIDSRPPDEFTGRMIAPFGLNETAQRGGHIPGAINIPWDQVVKSDGTFKSPAELRELFFLQHRMDPGQPAISYCRIGERACLTWFVLKYLLGVENSSVYYGGWSEYGSMVGLPIEKNQAG